MSSDLALHVKAGCSARIGLLACENDTLWYGAHNNMLQRRVDGTQKIRGVPGPVTTCTLVGAYLVIGCSNGKVLVCDKLTLSGDKIFELGAGVAYSASREKILVLGCIDGTVTVFDFNHSVRSKISLPAGKKITAVGAVSINGNHLVIISASDLSLLLYTDKGQLVISIKDHHQNWVNYISSGPDGMFLTGSQDKSIRLWRIKHGADRSASTVSELVSKRNTFNLEDEKYSIDTEGLLLGHEDAILSCRFLPNGQVLSSSADRTIIKWEEGEGAWSSVLQMGDLAGIGVAGNGDLYDAFMFPNGDIIAHNTNGTITRWAAPNHAHPIVLTSGHFKDVEDLCWIDDPKGQVLLSCSLDRTTRAWCLTEGDGHMIELARPQIHGYEVKSIVWMNPATLVSAGDEKVIRVFQAPRLFAERVSKLSCGRMKIESFLDTMAVSQPALGLSNKSAVNSEHHVNTHSPEFSSIPDEPELSSSTLFPEIDKLYGHGDELMCVAGSPDGHMIASASRANLAGDSSIRLWDAQTRLVTLTLRPHTLTVVRLAFSPNSTMLLSVGRDRRLAVSSVSDGSPIWVLEEAHERIIWDTVWLTDDVFVTVSRDKRLKVWSLSSRACVSEHFFDHPVTAVCRMSHSSVIVGLEDGNVFVKALDSPHPVHIDKANDRITRLAIHNSLLAVASADHSIRVYRLPDINNS